MCKQEICNLIKSQASPLSSPAILFNNKLFSLVKKNQFKVSLMGTGGDEALTGYYEHFIFDLVERLDNNSFKTFRLRLSVDGVFWTMLFCKVL